jgi:hypothetical protein
MASAQMFQLASQLRASSAMRDQLRADPRATIHSSGVSFGQDELDALDAVDWANMTDDELVTRVNGAFARPTTRTGP